MKTRSRRALALPLFLAAGWFFSLGGRSTARADAVLAKVAPGVEVAVVSTPPLGERTTVAWADASGAWRPIATLSHPRDASVHGAVLPGTRVIAVALDANDARDRSFASALVVVKEGAQPVSLVDGVAHAARPIATDDGKVVIERGAPGPVTTGADGKLHQRVDDLEVSEVDPVTAAVRPLLTLAGYTAHVVGVVGAEVLVYRVTPTSAELVAVHRSSRVARVVADLGPLARDFSVDRTTGSVVLSLRHRDGTSVVTRVDVATGALSELATATRDAVPFALPNGGVMFAPSLGGRSGSLGPAPVVSLPATGFFWGRAVAPAFVTGLVMEEGRLPRPVLVARADGAIVPLGGPPDERIDVIGFAPGGAQ